MTKPEPSDEELRELFQGDRARDLEWVPSFERTVAPRRASGRPALRWPALIALGAVLVAGMVFWRRADRSGEPALALIQFAPGDLRTPTDFLLDVPGAEFLQMVPELGRFDQWYPLSSGTRAERRSSRL